MGTQMSAADLELYRRVDEVLHYMWDPIGVAGTPQARDEYHAYLPHVFAQLKEDAGRDRIAEYLDRIASDRMGLESNWAASARVAECLLAWKAHSGL